MNVIKSNDKRFVLDKRLVTIFIIAVLSRYFLLWLGYMGLVLTNGCSDGFFKHLYEHFIQTGDSGHYINIAENWYASSGEDAKYIVFYPLYPILMRIVQTVVRSYFAAGLIVSDVCFGAACCYLYKIVEMDFDGGKARDAVFLLAAAPFGIFFCGIFTESLFFMLTAAGLYYIRKRNWIAAGIAGCLCSFTRTNGIVLLFAAGIVIIGEIIKSRKFNKKYLFALLIPVGMLAYFAINKAVQGDWLIFMQHEAAAPWYNSPGWYDETIATTWNMAQEHFSLSLIIYYPQLIMLAIGIASLFFAIKKGLPIEYIVYGGAYMAMAYMHGWMISGSRYMMCCVPLYIIFASIKSQNVRTAIMAVSAFLCVIIATLLWQGQAIM